MDLLKKQSSALSRFTDARTAEEFKVLLRRLTKATIATNPIDLYQFLADFTENELTKRSLLEFQTSKLL